MVPAKRAESKTRRSASSDSTRDAAHPDARVREIARPLGRWYQRRKRDLPWRVDQDPYRVWISEIMLQQTQVKTVIPYYERFLERFPDAEALAAASEDEVLEYWAGLGYYSRGRNLRRAAQQVVREHEGQFPDSSDRLRSLPGIGEYTAAAVGSIAFDEAVPVIDGNVERVLARFLAIEEDPRRGAAKARLRHAADAALARRRPGDHNQAMMELGATVCTPRSPSCHECPIARHCRAFDLGRPESYPPPKQRRPSETQHWIAALARVPEGWILTRSQETPFLVGQWGFPLVEIGPEAGEPDLEDSARELVREALGRFPRRRGCVGSVVSHSITFRRLRVTPVRFDLPKAPTPDDGIRILPNSRTRSLASLYRKVAAAFDDDANSI